MLRLQTDRNRLNQRNFRARRQAYIRDLQQRIRDLENQRFQATKEVQAAAQRVNSENQRLKRFLEFQFGVSRSQISKYLSDSEATSSIDRQYPSQRQDASPISRGLEELPRTLTLANGFERIAKPAPEDDPDLAEPSKAPEEEQIGRQIVLQSSRYKPAAVVASPGDVSSSQPPLVHSLPDQSTRAWEGALLNEQQGYDERRSPDSNHRSQFEPINQPSTRSRCTSAEWTDSGVGETSCEEAATIIASLRGHNVYEDVWSELGCSAKQTCRVKNLSVFELMDK